MRGKRFANFVKRRPKEVTGTLVGAVAGVPVGVAIGGIGIVALGGAIGIPAVAVFATIGAGIGNRIGIGLDRPEHTQSTSKKGAEQ